MSVSGVSSSSSIYQTDQTDRANTFQQIRQEFKQLATVLQSGERISAAAERREARRRWGLCYLAV